METLKKYLKNIFVSLDQLANTILGGDPDETISSRAGKGREKGKRWACVLCKVLDWIDKDHCKRSIEPTEGKNAIFPN